jgi:hypothetical protein
MIGDQLSLPVLHESLIDELRARRATKAIVGANAIVTLRRMQRAGEKVSRRSWNQAWALLEAAVPPLPPEHSITVAPSSPESQTAAQTETHTAPLPLSIEEQT